MTALLRLEGVSKSYGTVQANKSIDLTVDEASIHAILGENGAGKSTLMKLIYGVEEPDQGRVVWQGRETRIDAPSTARRLGIGMVFQHFSLFETLTVVENIALVVPGKRAELAVKVRDFGARFGLEVDPFASVHSLSMGERQRVEIIRCLLLNPKLLILDEPTSVLPPQSVERLFETLRLLREEGVSILFISHKLEEIRAICDAATVLRAGQVVERVDPRQASAADLARMMIGRDMPAAQPGLAHDLGEERLRLERVNHTPDDPFGVTLANVSLSLRGGEILGIAGISGNGQKELVRLISGETRLGRAGRDSIRLMGQPAGHLGAAARRELGFAFVPEERLGRGAVPDMTLADNTLLTAHARGMVRAGLIQRGRERDYTRRCIEEFDVRTAGPDVEAANLSGGNLQKFIMGREIHLGPKLLLCSQPTWGVDIGAATEIRRRLVALRDQGTAILILSDELSELFEICDRLQVLHHGELSPSLMTAATNSAEIGEYMLGRASKENDHVA
ncbi:ABC transporter ATP-binding protein [Paracoccus aminophilus]|uniref:ATPase n=1 Tax=Paracoccus aminophilus JCM 7686 TaxID=1367847 RepID=S5Y3F7_PARAH|nr:ABC transporter ATP-binding protein [Paracoccus aminophilus]AGT10285.1 ATPase [Paracoccus aminophilus JCM 7686]